MPGPRARPPEIEAKLGFPNKGGNGKSVASVKAKVAAAATLAPVGEPFADMSDRSKTKWRELAYVWRILLKESDRESLRVYCEVWTDLMEAQTMVAAFGSTALTAAGGEKESIWSVRVFRLRTALFKMMQDFGATPSARTRVELADPGPVAPTSKFNGLVN